VSVARDALRATNTGAWSRYSVGGAEATLDYQVLTTGFLERLCATTEQPLFCAPATRFARYLREPPQVALAAPARVRARRAATVRVWVSKVSTVRVRVAGARGALLDVERRVGRGSHVFAFAARRRDRLAVTATATALTGHRASRSATVRALPAKAKAKAKPKRKPRAARR
jgi:hypothetical protein